MYAGVRITSSPPFPPQLGWLWGFSFVIFSHAQSRGNIIGSTQRSTQWQNGTPLGGSTHFKNGAPL